MSALPHAHARNVLLTQGRSAIALAMARHLSRHHHRVFTLDTLKPTLCGASRAVVRAYRVHSPRCDTAQFVADVRRIVAREAIDIIVPIFEEGLYLAAHADLAELLFAPPLAVLQCLHDKFAFSRCAREAGLLVPKTVLLRCRDDLVALDRTRAYALKPCYSQAALQLVHLRRADPLPELFPTPERPWVAQQWFEGRRFCSYGIYVDGQPRAHTAYPVGYTLDGHSCVFYAETPHLGVAAWAHTLAAALRLTGQMACDFIEASDGRIYAIECNPRATAGAYLIAQTDALAKVIAGERGTAIAASPPSPRQIGAGMVLYAWRRCQRARHNPLEFLRALLTTRDVVFDWADPAPFLTQPLAFLSLWRVARRRGLGLPGAFLYDFVWQPGPQGEHML